jgi:hypothetical protein
MSETAEQVSMRTARPLTYQRLAEAHRAGMQAIEPHQRMMEKVASCATMSVTISADGVTLISSGYDQQTQECLDKLKAQADMLFLEAVERVLGR